MNFSKFPIKESKNITKSKRNNREKLNSLWQLIRPNMFEQIINLIYKMYTWLLEKEYAKNVKVKFKKA